MTACIFPIITTVDVDDCDHSSFLMGLFQEEVEIFMILNRKGKLIMMKITIDVIIKYPVLYQYFSFIL